MLYLLFKLDLMQICKALHPEFLHSPYILSSMAKDGSYCEGISSMMVSSGHNTKSKNLMVCISVI